MCRTWLHRHRRRAPDGQQLQRRPGRQRHVHSTAAADEPSVPETRLHHDLGRTGLKGISQGCRELWDGGAGASARVTEPSSQKRPPHVLLRPFARLRIACLFAALCSAAAFKGVLCAGRSPGRRQPRVVSRRGGGRQPIRQQL
jgi:hypothetical protein